MKFIKWSPYTSSLLCFATHSRVVASWVAWPLWRGNECIRSRQAPCRFPPVSIGLPIADGHRSEIVEKQRPERSWCDFSREASPTTDSKISAEMERLGLLLLLCSLLTSRSFFSVHKVCGNNESIL